jgi:rubrerythrin
MKSTNIDTQLHVDQDVIKHLNELIQLDFDASKTYEQALEHVDNEAAREDLEDFRADHERHIVELTRVVEDLGGEVVRLDLPPMALEVVTRNLEDERHHLAAIENHIDRIAGEDQYVEVPESYPPSSPRTPTIEKPSH